jgi:diaminopimelate decarboxylase
MASNYNRLGRPAVVFVADGRARLIIKRESYSDQLKLEIGGEDN